ncbi:chaplin [Streptomyces sp. AV19]|uniref:chaplin n=1 Tax=Streptomyces sp. AV19 TaxID=2793068 RepID=UPI0018FE636B|nr:chaplin [Streptomyces sp. AV19]MBH1936644.1 chaplin [Streptomyces sp. AV19]
MRQVAKKGLLTAAAAGTVLAAAGGYAYADSGAQGAAAHSPGVGSGNTVQAPVHVPVNVCGNTVNVVGLLNPATGNTCVNGGHGHHAHGGHGGHGQGHHNGGAQADGAAVNSPGVVSGNVIQAPVHVPVNACGNSVNVVGLGNPATGNTCVNDGQHHKGHDHGTPHHPGKPAPHQPSHHNPPAHHPGKPSEAKPPAGHDSPPAEHSVHKPGHHAVTPVTPVVKGWHRPADHPAAAPAAPAEEKATELAHTGAGELGMAGAASAALLAGGTMLYRRARAGQQG